jgi:hypothetical protein
MGRSLGEIHGLVSEIHGTRDFCPRIFLMGTSWASYHIQDTSTLQR